MTFIIIWFANERKRMVSWTALWTGVTRWVAAPKETMSNGIQRKILVEPYPSRSNQSSSIRLSSCLSIPASWALWRGIQRLAIEKAWEKAEMAWEEAGIGWAWEEARRTSKEWWSSIYRDLSSLYPYKDGNFLQSRYWKDVTLNSLYFDNSIFLLPSTTTFNN